MSIVFDLLLLLVIKDRVHRDIHISTFYVIKDIYHFFWK